jgi:hypothetical protein
MEAVLEISTFTVAWTYIPTLFFDKDSDSVYSCPLGLVGYVWKVSYPNSLLVQAAQGPTASSFFINGRPCAPAKVQKAINEVYRTFNANQSPFVIADFVLPTGTSISLTPLMWLVMGVNLVQIRVTSM